jgi:hypothetical protein
VEVKASFGDLRDGTETEYSGVVNQNVQSSECRIHFFIATFSDSLLIFTIVLDPTPRNRERPLLWIAPRAYEKTSIYAHYARSLGGGQGFV